jgi:hypothetical protein
MSHLCGVDVGEVLAAFRLQTGAAEGTGINYLVYITPVLHEAEKDLDVKTANFVNFLRIMNQIRGKVKNYPHFCFSNLFTQK